VLFQRLRIYANNPLTIGEMGIGHEDTKEQDALREALVNLLFTYNHSAKVHIFALASPKVTLYYL
jgi:hypothetical protein